jgi:bifunctional UDP-N-acetylglucosamine pyrophosphorylase/glucosamine-1-phosphate N-acetyltransferase
MAQLPVLIVLAGGASSRMWPLREKSLLRFGAEPLLLAQLRRFEPLGFTQAVVVANPANRDDIAALVETLAPKMRVETVVQAQPQGMGDALLQTEVALAATPNTPIYITQVHDVVDDTLHKDMLKAFNKKPDAAHLAGYEVDAYFPGGYLSVDGDGRITGIVEKPGAGNEPSNLVNIVAHTHPDAARLFSAIRAEYARDVPGDDHYERAMDALMQDMTYRVVPYRGPWKALKYPWHVLDVMTYFLEQIDGQVVADDAFIAPGATLVGNVYIGPGARVFPGAAVVGPAYIGAGTIVGNSALVRNSMVLDRCEVGYTTEVARSYVADHCGMHACRVLDTVFAERVNFSAGCTTANLRIDHGDVPSMIKGQRVYSGRDKLGAIIGEGAFIAVDAMTMPGVKIGERAQIGPGTHVRHDVEDGKRVYVKQEIVVEDV